MRGWELRRVAAVVLGLGLLGGCGENPAENVPAAVTGPATGSAEAVGVMPSETPAASGELAGTTEAPGGRPSNATRVVFSGANGSTIGFIGSKSVGGAHDGGFKSFEGSFVLDEANGSLAGVTAEIDMHSIWSDDDKLTAHLKNADFFEVDTYPKSRFVSTEVVSGGSGGSSHSIRGELTMHGATRSILIPANVEVSEDAISLTSEFSIKKSDFGMTFSGPGNVIRDEVVIKLDVKAPRGVSN